MNLRCLFGLVDLDGSHDTYPRRYQSELKPRALTVTSPSVRQTRHFSNTERLSSFTMLDFHPDLLLQKRARQNHSLLGHCRPVRASSYWSRKKMDFWLSPSPTTAISQCKPSQRLLLHLLPFLSVCKSEQTPHVKPHASHTPGPRFGCGDNASVDCLLPLHMEVSVDDGSAEIGRCCSLSGRAMACCRAAIGCVGRLSRLPTVSFDLKDFRRFKRERCREAWPLAIVRSPCCANTANDRVLWNAQVEVHVGIRVPSALGCTGMGRVCIYVSPRCHYYLRFFFLREETFVADFDSAGRFVV